MGKKLTGLDHMRDCAEAAKGFANGLAAEVAAAAAEAIEELEEKVDTIDQKVGGFSYSEEDEVLTVPAANGTVADETLILI